MSAVKKVWQKGAVKVWLVGDRGMLGTSMRAQLETAGVPFLGSDQELDITDREQALAFAKQEGFTHILNCAAYTNVDGAETEEELATRVNGGGAGNLAASAAACGAKLLHVSTDYVFEGNAEQPYREDAPTGPIGAYGRSKLAGEQAIWQELPIQAPSADAPSASVVRTSWLFGPRGKNFVTTMLRLMAERPLLRVVADQRGKPTYCPDLAHACVEVAGLTGKRCEPGLYHFANSGECSWHDFACEILRLAKAAGLPIRTERVEAIATSEYPTPAKRPPYSVLDTSRITAVLGREPRPWPVALAEYINEIANQSTP